MIPLFLEYVAKYQKLPTHLTFSLACLIRFYQGSWNNKKLPIKDELEIVEAFAKIWSNTDYANVSKAALATTSFWGEDLTKIESLTQAITLALNEIETNGVEKGFANFSQQF